MKKRLTAMIFVMSMLLNVMQGMPVSAAAAAAETYTWVKPASTTGGKINGTYSVGSAVKLYDTEKSEVSEALITAADLDKLKDGSYDTMLELALSEKSESVNSIQDENNYFQIEFDEAYKLTRVFAGFNMARKTENPYLTLGIAQVKYHDPEDGTWKTIQDTNNGSNVISSTINAGATTANSTAAVTNKLVYEVAFKSAVRADAVRFYPIRLAASATNELYILSELVAHGMNTYQKDIENYDWATETSKTILPINGTYSRGNAVAPYSNTALNADFLKDGDYTTCNKVKFSNNTATVITEGQYWQVEFSRPYDLSRVDVGFYDYYSVGANAPHPNSIPARSILHYKDADTGEWTAIDKSYDTLWHNDTRDTYTDAKHGTIRSMAVGNIRATGIRYYPVRLYQQGTNPGFYHLSELIAYGKPSYEKAAETYDWLSPGSEATAPINGIYAIGSAVTLTDASKVTKETPSFLNDGDYSNYIEASLNVTSGISKIENHYYEVTFENDIAYEISEVIVGFPETGVTVPARAQLQYKDPLTNAWVDVDYYETANSERAYAPYWPVDGTLTIKNKWTKALPVDNIIAKGIRFYPARLTGSGAKGYYRLSELIVRGKNVSDVIEGNITFTADGETSEDFDADATSAAANISIINPTAGIYDNAKIITAFYNDDALVDVNMVSAVSDKGVSYSSPMIINVSGLDIPDSATKVKMYFWNSDTQLKPISGVFEKTKIVYAADNENIKYAGRWTADDRGSKTSYFGGAYAEANFTGDNAVVVLGDTPQGVHIIVDGTEDYRPEAYGDIDVSSLLDKNITVHTIRVVSKFYNDNVILKGFMFDGIAARTADKPIIEFIGDSITAGHMGSPATNIANRAMIAYPYLVGEALGCDHTQVAISARPLITATEGWKSVGMSEEYFRIGPGKSGENWDFTTAYTPDMVVINLGTNDASTTVMGTVPTDEVFTEKYVEFVNNIRAKYADAEIFLMGTFAQKYIDATKAAVSQLQTTDTKVHYIDTTGWLSKSNGDYCSDGVHPSIAGHKKIAEKLKTILQEYLIK